MFDYSKVRGKIRELYATQESFAKAMGMSTATLSDKLNNKVQWNQKEIDKASDLFGINKEEIPAYFFTPEVQEVEHDVIE